MNWMREWMVQGSDEDIDSPNTQGGDDGVAGGAAKPGKRKPDHASNLPALKKNTFVFPQKWEQALDPFDTKIIALVQAFHGVPVLLFSLLFTLITSIETVLPLPFAFFTLGYDRFATVISVYFFVAVLVSQVPKRFVWRARPWMTGRAKQRRKDGTSSFPSRGVTCGVVFPTAVLLAIETERALPFSSRFKLLVTVVCVVGTFFARVYVGAHYPSDGVAGALLGMLICAISTQILKVFDVLGCAVDGTASYSAPPVGGVWQSLSAIDPLPLSVCFALSLTLTLVSLRDFWTKCAYVYGILLPCLSFRVAFLCPSLARASFRHSALPAMPAQSLSVHATFGVVTTAFLVFGMLTRAQARRRTRIGVFVLIYTGELLVMIAWRLRSLQRVGLP